MIKIKHLCDPVEKDDGKRLWIEPMGLTKDMQEWCKVDHVLSHLGPPKQIWDWFQKHPTGYEHFRGKYHESLASGPYKEPLKMMASAGQRENFTLVHSGENDCENSGTALYEYLSDLASYCPPE